jgi:branched-subunit amino acid transport protein
MTGNTMFLVIAGMALVTYLPRLLPFVLFEEVDYPAFLSKILENLRYAILGALIFPGLFLVQEDPYFGILGGSVAFVLSYFGLDIVLVVLGTVGAMSLYSFIF